MYNDQVVTDVAVQGLREMMQRRALVTFGPESDDWSTYPEVGMRARVVGVDRMQNLDDGGFACVRVTFDFVGMDEHNLPFESTSFYDKNHNPTLTAREAGHFKEQHTFSVNALDWSRAFTPVSGLVETLTRLHAKSGSDLPYLAWVEEAAARDLGVHPTQEASLPSPA